MKLYLKNGYLNIEGLLRQSLTFNFMIGGRGTGKTYGILKYILDNRLKVFLVRRHQTQVDIISKPEFNPFKALERDIEVRSSSKYHSSFYRGEECIGYVAALSTFSKIRGFDASDIDIMFYDEFIPEAHERPIKDEAAALFNAYETINRNRELQGRKPLVLVCAANSNRIDNVILQGFNLLPRLEKLAKSGKELSIDHERSILLAYLHESPISEAKADTVLYKALRGEKYSDMAIENRFEFSGDRIESKDLRQYRLMVKVGSLGVYIHRHERSNFYVRTTKETARYEYDDTADDLKKFRSEFPFVAIWDVKGLIHYENLDVFTRFRNYLTT